MADGLYKKAFSNEGLSEDQTNAHWKHEQDNYLTNIGAMELIKRDPMASLGYRIRSNNPNQTLDMGSGVSPEEDGMYGLYRFRPSDYKGFRFDGSLDVAVDQPTDRYGQVVAHELGHVGSRNSQTDEKITANAGDEEKRQRITDLANLGSGPPQGQDALQYLMREGMPFEDVLAAVKQRRVEMGLEAPSPAPAAEKKPAKKKTRKKLKTVSLKANPEAGID